MINGIITEKLGVLDEVLAELASLGRVTSQRLDKEWITRRAVERDLQVLIEVIIDICHRLISLEGKGPATSGVDAIKRCIANGILSENVVYPNMVRFRNFLVHRYERVETSILADLLSNHLVDFQRFREEVLLYIGQETHEKD